MNEREGEREGERKGYSFSELSSHDKDSYDYASNCYMHLDFSFLLFYSAVHFPYKEHYSLPRTSDLIFFPPNDVRKS